MTDHGAHRPAERSTFTLVARSLLGGIWFGLWFFVAFPGGLLYFSGESFWPPPGPSRFIGIALIAVSLAVLAALVARFASQGRGTLVPLDPPKKIVSRGLYARVRNPMYAAYIVIASGEAILYRSWTLLAYAAVFALLLHGYVVRVEEPRLRARFGAEYDRYSETSGRWLPRR